MKKRVVVRGIVDCAVFLATHELPYRGGNENRNSINRGNFKYLFAILGTRDSAIEGHLKTATVWRVYSKTIQNDFISIIAEEVKGMITQEIQRSSFLAIEFDDSTDVSHETQCLIIL